MVRSAYGIGDPSLFAEDCLLSICCHCCVINQLYQTTSKLGNPTSDGGKSFNKQEMINADCTCCGCIYFFLCMQCSIGNILKKSVGMPWMLGCCCFNLFSAHNIFRYQYRLRNRVDYSTDCRAECCRPIFMFGAGGLPCINCVIEELIPLHTSMLREVTLKKGGENQSYLKGYTPWPTAPEVHIAAVAPTVPYIITGGAGQ